VAQVVACLPNKCEALNSNPNTTKKKKKKKLAVQVSCASDKIQILSIFTFPFLTKHFP
jgi:hypothetical protein